MRLRRLILVVCLAALGAGASGLGPSLAQVTVPTTTTTTTTVTLSLGFSTPPGALTDLRPGTDSTTSAVASVTAPGAWTLRVVDTDASSPAPGHLLRVACTQGAPALAQPLSLSTSFAGTLVAVALSGVAQTLTSGTAGTWTVPIDYRQPVGSGEQLAAGCLYQVTISYLLG